MDNKQNKKKIIEAYIKKLLVSYGEDIKRDGLIETPSRIARMYDELFKGYSQDPKSVFKMFDVRGYNDLIVVSGIKFYSLCEHHMLPFFGKVHIGYLANKKILGLSKFARLVDIFARRLQTQENLTNQIVLSLEKYLEPKGLIVNVQAEHLCMAMRGVNKIGSETITTICKGEIKKNKELIDRFFKEIYQGNKK